MASRGHGATVLPTAHVRAALLEPHPDQYFLKKRSLILIFNDFRRRGWLRGEISVKTGLGRAPGDPLVITGEQKRGWAILGKKSGPGYFWPKIASRCYRLTILPEGPMVYERMPEVSLDPWRHQELQPPTGAYGTLAATTRP